MRLTACLTFFAGVALLAGACGTENVKLGQAGNGITECATSECGPALGIPNYACSDGTVGGPTGVCLQADDGTCGWEVRQCTPADECEPGDCGPQLGLPNYVCEDGTFGGPTG